jgi:hypothetical protein
MASPAIYNVILVANRDLNYAGLISFQIFIIDNKKYVVTHVGRWL